MDVETNKWFYDEILALNANKELEDRARIRKIQRMVNAKGQGNGESFEFQRINPETGVIVTIPFRCSKEYRPYAEMDLDNFASAMQFRLSFVNTPPFLIGPATLDSLLDKPVGSYDYIEDGKFPFNPIFFEFMDDIPAKIPRIKRSDVKLKGIYLCKGTRDYVFSSFWKDAEGEIIGVDLFMKDPRARYFRGMVSHFSRSNFDLDNGRLDRNRYNFLINMDKNKLHIAQSLKKEAAFAQAMHNWNPDKLYDFNELFDETIPLDSVPNDAFSMVPNLATNLVNYINAHNIRTIKITGSAPRKLMPSTEKPDEDRPFYLVTVKDGQRIEYEEQRKVWDLQWRIFVRGHDRKYRDHNTQQILKTSWIPPHVKDPPTAPWREQRYEVLAQKLLRE